jgi:hypothetical protein
MISKKLFAFAAAGLLIPPLALAADDACSMSIGNVQSSPDHWESVMKDFSANSKCRNDMYIVKVAEKALLIQASQVFEIDIVVEPHRARFVVKDNLYPFSRNEVVLLIDGQPVLSSKCGLELPRARSRAGHENWVLSQIPKGKRVRITGDEICPYLGLVGLTLKAVD